MTVVRLVMNAFERDSASGILDRLKTQLSLGASNYITWTQSIVWNRHRDRTGSSFVPSRLLPRVLPDQSFQWALVLSTTVGGASSRRHGSPESDGYYPTDDPRRRPVVDSRLGQTRLCMSEWSQPVARVGIVLRCVSYLDFCPPFSHGIDRGYRLRWS